MISEEEKKEKQKIIEEEFYKGKNLIFDEFVKQEYYKKCLKMLINEIRLLKNEIEILGGEI